MLRFIFVLLFIKTVSAGTFLKEIHFSGKTTKLDSKNWAYYHPTKFMKGKVKVLESKKIDNLIGFHSTETQVKENFKLTINEDFKKKCIKSLPIKLKQPRVSKIIRFKNKDFCQHKTSKKDTISIQYLSPSKITKDFKNGYKLDVLSFTFPKERKDADKAINSFIEELL